MPMDMSPPPAGASAGEVTIMFTPGNNPHSPESHAEVTTNKIIGESPDALVHITPTAAPEARAAAKKLRADIFAILLSHHTGIAQSEERKLAELGLDRLDDPLDATLAIGGSVAQELLLDSLLGTAKGTLFEESFIVNKLALRDAIAHAVLHETRSQMNVHRIVYQRAREMAH